MDIKYDLDQASQHTWDNFEEIDAISEYCEQFFDFLQQKHRLDYFMLTSAHELQLIDQIDSDEKAGKPVTAIEGYDIHLQAIKRELGEARFRRVFHAFHTSQFTPNAPDDLLAYEIPLDKVRSLRFPALAEALDHLYEIGPQPTV